MRSADNGKSNNLKYVHYQMRLNQAIGLISFRIEWYQIK